jgi:hypothetical protein
MKEKQAGKGGQKNHHRGQQKKKGGGKDDRDTYCNCGKKGH